MTSGNASLGFHPPQQARSRAALQRILAAAEQVLAATGFDAFTMAAVADRAGLSVGAIYRRFEGKEQLLNAVKDRLLSRVEDDITAALAAADGGLPAVIAAFTHALADGFSAGVHVVPQLVGKTRATESSERSHRALENIERQFFDAARAHSDEIRRSDPMKALVIAFRTIMAACVHRTATYHAWPDGISWKRWAEQIADMATVYLTTPDPDDRPTE